MNFECKKCGMCCKNFGEKHFLPIFEWEKDELEEEAKLMGVSLHFKAVDMMLDKRSNSAICFQLAMKNEPCPFLYENICKIYDKRPLICRSFPLHDSPILKKELNFNLSSFLRCENFDFKKLLIEGFEFEEGKQIRISKGAIAKKYISTFGYEPVIAVTQKAMIEDFIDKIMRELLDKKIIKLRKINYMDYQKYNPIPIFEFAIKTNLLSSKAKI